MPLTCGRFVQSCPQLPQFVASFTTHTPPHANWPAAQAMPPSSPPSSGAAATSLVGTRASALASVLASVPGGGVDASVADVDDVKSPRILVQPPKVAAAIADTVAKRTNLKGRPSVVIGSRLSRRDRGV
jgi:hypothetical protein